MIDMIREIANARQHSTKPWIRRKDLSNHHIPTPDGVPSMQEMMDAADREASANDITVDHPRYVRDAGVENDDLAGRLRHRATMMRQRADQFDLLADQFVDSHLRSLEAAVRSYDELGGRIRRLLEEHKHVEPTRE